MELGIGLRKSSVVLMMLGSIALLGGCATKKYVRTEVSTSAHEISGRIDNQEQTINGHEQVIKSNTGQIEELGSVARDHSQKLGVLDDGLHQTDAKAQHAMSVGEGAQNAANKAAGEVTALDSRFQNRNHYMTLSEEQVRFKFNSAKLEDSFKKVLDDIANNLKQNPDAILVMEGHTDATGSEDYNIQLGQKRVEAVVRYLVVDQEVPMNRISDLSFGEAKAIAENKTKEGRAQNRAVVVRVMAPQFSGQSAMTSQAKPDETETR